MMADHSSLTLQLLGGFCLAQGGERVAVSQPAEKLLAFLGLHQTFLARRYVSGSLWCETSDERASGRLRTALWQLRAIDPLLVSGDRARIGLGPIVQVDVRQMERQATRLLNHKDGHDVDLELFRDDLLPDWNDEWVMNEQIQLRHLRLEVLDTIASDSLRRGDYGTAGRSALTAARADPLRESSHRLLVRAHLASGNRVEAMRQFSEYADLLQREFGLTPSSAMVALTEGLISSGAAHDRDTSPSAS